MTRIRRVFLGVFALISSCGAPPEGGLDTASVGAETRAPDALRPVRGDEATAAGGSVEAAAPSVSLPPLAATELVGFAGERFAVVDTAEGTIVFDAEYSSAFRVYGHPLTTSASSFDPWEDAGLYVDSRKSDVVTDASGTRMLMRTEHGVQAVDLSQRGALLAGWRGDARGASLSADGEMFATWSDAAITLVRVSDGARVAYAIEQESTHDGIGVAWTPRSVHWIDIHGVHLVDRATWREQRIDLPHATVLASKEGTTFAVYRDAKRDHDEPRAVVSPGVVEVWRLGESKPAARVTSAFVASAIMDPDATKIAWVEYTEEIESAHLHTLDVATGVHVRFASKATGCRRSYERLVTIENGELHTDGECSTGCPSFTRQAQLMAYDFASGRVVRTWQGPLEPAPNLAFGARLTVREQLAKRYGFDPAESGLPILHHPSQDLVLVGGEDGLRLDDVPSGARRVKLGSAVGFPPNAAHFWPNSASRIVGVLPGEIAVWDAATGTRIWATSR